MDRDFERVYAGTGRESVAPERLLRARAVQVLYSIRSDRLLCEQLDYNLLFRRFVGLTMDDEIWDHSTFTKNRHRLTEAGVDRKMLRRNGRRDGKDDPPPGRNPHVDFHQERRSNETHGGARSGAADAQAPGVMHRPHHRGG
jgi:hypothetical protein